MNIVIVGGGTAGWLSALSLSKNHNVSIIDSDIPTIGVGESTTDRLVEWLQRHNVDMNDFIKKVNGTKKLASHFTNFSYDYGFFHPFNVRDDRDFYDVSKWAYTNQAPLPGLSEFYHHLLNKTAPDNFDGVAVHWENGLVPTYFNNMLGDTIKVHKDTVVDIIRKQDNIDSIVLSSGETLKADLYVDCTGFHKKLIGNDHFESWNQKGQVDTAIAWQEDYDQYLPYTELTAMEYGWSWTIHTKDRAGRGYVFDSEYTSIESAKKEAGVTDCRVIHFDPGVQKNMWKGNTVAVGLSAHFLEPMEATNIEFATKQLDMIKQVLESNATVEQFNRTMYNNAHEIRAFIKLHYINNQYIKTDFWSTQKNSNWFDPIYDELVTKSNLDYIKQTNWEWYDIFSWLCILQGLNITPKHKIDNPALLAKYQLMSI